MIRCIVLLLLIIASNSMGDELAGRADDFVNTIGIQTHPPYGGYPIYANTNLVTTNLANLGVRYTRCDGHNQNWEWDYWNSLYTNYGIKRIEIFWAQSSMTNWAISNMVALVDKYPAMMLAVEGPNETDGSAITNGWMTYHGTNFPMGTIYFQNDLYNAMKADAVASNLPVLAPTVANATNSIFLAGCMLDYENMHSYAGGLLPDNGLDTWWIPYADEIITPTKPIYATECGYHTAINLTNQDQAGVSERAQGKYVPRLFGEYWNRNIVRANIYELLDEGTNLLYSQDCYGIVHQDGTPKPAYTAMKNMIALLSDTNDIFTPNVLTFGLSGNTSNIHYTLLQKGGYAFYLLIWQNVSCFNQSTKKDVTNATVPVTFTLPATITNAITYSYDDSGNLSTNAAAIVSNAVSLNVPDSVLFVQLASSGPPTPAIIKDNSDNSGIVINGTWYASTFQTGYYGPNYLDDGATGGGKSVEFIPNVITSGYYDVYDRWTSGTLRATNAPIDVDYAGGSSTFYVNQQTNNGTWVWLGTFPFNAGTGGNVRVRDDGASSYVIADAVEFILHCPAPIPPVSPVLSASGSNSQVLLVWTAVTNAASYNIQRSTNNNGSYTVIAAVTTTNYTDIGLACGTTYYYAVAAVNACSQQGSYSGSSSVTTVPNAPLGLNASGSNTEILVSWTASAGATSYNVKRSTTNGGPYSTIIGVTATNYSDTAVTNGTTYYYVVSALNTSGESTNSSQASATPSATPPAPFISGVTLTNGMLQMSVSGNQGYSYIVQTSTNLTSSWQTLFATNPQTMPFQFIDTRAPTSPNRFYRVQALSIVPPSDLTVYPGNVKTHLSWTSSQGATGYNLKRSITSGGPYTAVTSQTLTNYNDTAVTNGTTYYYVVSALNTSGESANSNEAGAVPQSVTMIKDNSDANGITIIGAWITSTSASGYYGPNYLEDGAAGGGKSVQFIPTIATAGYYDVYARWTSGTLRAVNAPIDVNYSGGKTTFYENQQVNGGTWVWLGTFFFSAGSGGSVTVRDDGTSSYVVADAVEFILN